MATKGKCKKCPSLLRGLPARLPRPLAQASPLTGLCCCCSCVHDRRRGGLPRGLGRGRGAADVRAARRPLRAGRVRRALGVLAGGHRLPGRRHPVRARLHPGHEARAAAARARLRRLALQG